MINSSPADFEDEVVQSYDVEKRVYSHTRPDTAALTTNGSLRQARRLPQSRFGNGRIEMDLTGDIDGDGSSSSSSRSGPNDHSNNSLDHNNHVFQQGPGNGYHVRPTTVEIPEAGRTATRDVLNNPIVKRQDTVIRQKEGFLDFFGSEVFNMVLHNPTTSHRFLRFCQSRSCGESMEFLEKVRHQIYMRTAAQIL